MAKLPTYEEMGKKIAEEALDGYIYKGKTLREWIDILAQTRWIPVKYRDMTQEEIERYREYTEVTKVFDCKMPDDGQDILVSTRSGIVTTDVCDIDDMDGYGLEDYGDWEDILAWMPLPEPYKEVSE